MRPLMLVAATLLASLAGCNQAESPPAQRSQRPPAPTKLDVGQKAPEIEGVDLDGKQFKLSDYQGKVVLLDFWSTG